MAFEEELIALLPRLRRFARGLVQQPGDADDLVQAAIERALKAREQWVAGTKLDSWMFKIMKNLRIDEARAAARRGPHSDIDDPAIQSAGDGDRALDAAMELSDVDRAMQRLPEDQRMAVMLVLVEGYSYKEAADILDIPQGTLTSRLGRGRTALIEQLDEAA